MQAGGRVLKSFSLARAQSFAGTRQFASRPDQYIVLEYDYVPDIATRRTPFRPSHLAHATNFKTQGRLVTGGPFTNLSGALFLFKNMSPPEVEKFVHEDPYYQNQCITSFRVREWNMAFPVEQQK
eukprot:c8847_g1_i3.p1 GENE.c8847_g1_i3~~c8847_g1_i3.p1  ORF type:complete len:125 (-),score=8.85 c8847_g1_i3:256-630(-)